MKNLRASALVPFAFSLSSFAEPTLYGKANVSIHNFDNGTDSVIEVKSHGSRLGVKGELDTDGGVTAIYQAEFQVEYDDGANVVNGQAILQRNTFVGLKGAFGTLKAGRYDSPFKSAQKKIDGFGDIDGDIVNLITNHDNRVSNIVSYTSPNFSGFSATVGFVASEDEDVDDGVSSAFSYEQDDLYLALAYNSDMVAPNVEAPDSEVTRLVAQYTIGSFLLGALYETVEAPAVDDTDAIFFSVQYSINKWILKGQFGQSDIDEEGGESLSLGFDYNLGKSVVLYTYYTALESDEGTDEDTIGNAGETYLGAGVVYYF